MAINSVKKNKFGQKGFGLVEIILVAGIGIVVFLGFEQYLNLSLRSVQQDKGHIEALYLVQSMLEQSRAVRDEAWTNISGLTPGSSYYFSTAGTSPDRWITQAGTLTN